MRGLISRAAVTAGLRGNDHLLLFNSSHLANWERLRAPELKFPPAGSAPDNQWLCLRRGRTEGKDGRGEPRGKPLDKNQFHFQEVQTGNTFGEQSFRRWRRQTQNLLEELLAQWDSLMIIKTTVYSGR